ncbi:hypothetical protein [Nocardioides agariphilus]
MGDRLRVTLDLLGPHFVVTCRDAAERTGDRLLFEDGQETV